MSNLTVQSNIFSLLDQWMQSERDGVQFPVPFESAWRMAGYSTKGNAKRQLTKLQKDIDYLSLLMNSSGGKPFEDLRLSCDTLKHFCMLAGTPEGRAVRNYFIDAEKKWKLTQQIAPQVASDVEVLQLKLQLAQLETQKALAQSELAKELTLQNEVLGKQLEMRHLDNTMLTLHGAPIVLALRGCADQIIREETIVTEVCELATGASTKILSAEQLKAVVKKRTGQKLPSLKYFAEQLRKAGRDDLLIAVRRSSVSEYPIPEKLDEAIAIVYGRFRQKLIGE